MSVWRVYGAYACAVCRVRVYVSNPPAARQLAASPGGSGAVQSELGAQASSGRNIWRDGEKGGCGKGAEQQVLH